MKPEFKTEDKVTSPIEPLFLGMVTSVIHQADHFLYTVTYYKDEEPKAVNMFGFELKLAPADVSMGFHPDSKEG